MAICDSLHDTSSDMSPQSSSRSHLQAWGMHRLFWHENWSDWQDWAEKYERSHLILSHVHKSMQDAHNNTNNHYYTRMSVRTLHHSITQSMDGLKAIGKVLLLDGLSVTCCLATESTQAMSRWCRIYMSICRWGSIHHPVANAGWLIL